MLASFNSQEPFDFPVTFPLVPPQVDGTQVNVVGALHAGSPFYVDIVQAPQAAGFALRLSGASGLVPESVAPRLAVIRIH